MSFPSIELATTYARARRLRTGRDQLLQAVDLIRGRRWFVKSI